MLTPQALRSAQHAISWRDVWSRGTACQYEGDRPTGGADGQQIIPRAWRIWSSSRQWEIKWPVIRRTYAVRDAVAAAAFALDRTYLLDFLLEAYPKLASLFEPGCAIRLERAADPDVADRRYFLVTLMTSLPVGEALARMDRFTEDWWLTHIARAGRDLVFVVDFA